MDQWFIIYGRIQSVCVGSICRFQNTTNIADPLKSDYLKQASGDMIRTQLQINY